MTDAPRSYPDKLEVKPLERPPAATVRVPGSKSITNRALVLAALSCRHSECVLTNILHSEDTAMMTAALRALGFRVRTENESSATVRVSSPKPDTIIPNGRGELFVGNSGTTMRFLTAMVALGHGRYRLDGIARMRERPIEDLLHALRQLGVSAYSEVNNGCPPVVVEASGIRGGTVHIKGALSSQFLSGLLMAAPLADGDVRVEIDGPLVSEPYVTMTVAMMRRAGIDVQDHPTWRYQIPGRQEYRLYHYDIEADASAASYFFGAAAVTGGTVSVGTAIKDPRLPTHQGDYQFVDLLERMGCRVKRGGYSITVQGGPKLRGIDVDMNAISDTVMTLAAVACFADGPTTIRNVAHIRHKETDRLAALATELRRVGAEVEEFADGLTITPRPLHGAEIETYNDHRMAMSMALIGLRVPGIVIKNPGCVAKTYPGFWDDLERLRG